MLPVNRTLMIIDFGWWNVDKLRATIPCNAPDQPGAH
jgi:hypothetical protein